MHFSLSLLKKLVPGLPPKKKLEEAISAHTFEVEGIEGNSLDLALYANRYADAASHWGIARELAAMFSLKAELPRIKQGVLPTNMDMITPVVKAKKACRRYSARVFDVRDMNLKMSSLIKKTLEESHIQSISPIVDLMNYVMLETGQPLHAFDADRLIGKKLIVRHAEEGESLLGLDKVPYTLSPGMLVIADEKQPQAIAGIRGGFSSGVTDATTQIIVEAATFDAVHIHEASRALKLHTDASLRFAHGLPTTLVDLGMSRVTQLLTDAGAIVVDGAEYYPEAEKEQEVVFDLHAYESLMGDTVSMAQVKRILKTLGFCVEKGKTPHQFVVTVPTIRPDVTTQEDLIEEVARLVGYDSFPVTPLRGDLLATEDHSVVTRRDEVLDLMVSLGMDEVRLYSFISHASLEELGTYESLLGKVAPIELVNPMSEEQTHIRTTLLPRLLESAEQAMRRNETPRLIELGRVAGNKKGKLVEELALGAACANLRDDEGVFVAKAVLEKVVRHYGATPSWKERGSNLDLHVGSKKVGSVLVVPRGKRLVGLGELLVERLPYNKKRTFVVPSKFPQVTRDIALLVSSGIGMGSVITKLEKADVLIQDIALIERYQGKELGSAMSVTVRITMGSPKRTLTEEDISTVMEKTEKIVKGHKGLSLRT